VVGRHSSVTATSYRLPDGLPCHRDHFEIQWLEHWLLDCVVQRVGGGKKMGRSLMFTLASFVVCGLLSATPPTCSTGTLASYIALGAEGCTFDGNVFANFTYSAKSSGDAPIVKANQITVVPIFLAPETTRFNFSAPWNVGSQQSQDSVIGYTVALPCGDTRTAELDLLLGTTQIKNIFGGVTVDESTNLGKLSVFTRCTEVCQTKTSDSLSFSPVSVLLINEHVNITGGNGGASLNEFTAQLNLCYLCP
jgi:hypothetical protein